MTMMYRLHQKWYTDLVFNLLYSGDLSVWDSNWSGTDSDLVPVGHFCAVGTGSVRVLGGLWKNHSCTEGGRRRCVRISILMLPSDRPPAMSLTF